MRVRADSAIGEQGDIVSDGVKNEIMRGDGSRRFGLEHVEDLASRPDSA